MNMESPEPTKGYPKLKAEKKTGEEPFKKSGRPIGPKLIDFWKWNSSDLISNATRGCLAEFIVAHALGLADKIRYEWCPFDLETKSKIKVEVKSAAYLQSWFHKELSKIVFPIRPTRSWDSETNVMAAELKRQADVYVFCLLNYDKKDEKLDPLNLDQWDFYVLGASVLDERLPNAKTISLNALKQLSPREAKYEQLAGAVESCRVNDAL